MNNYQTTTKSTLTGIDIERPIEVSIVTKNLTSEQIAQLARNEITRMVNAKLRDCKDGKLGRDGRAFRETIIRERKMSFDVASEMTGTKIPLTDDTLLNMMAASAKAQGKTVEEVMAEFKTRMDAQ
jgi:hypothetical protein